MTMDQTTNEVEIMTEDWVLSTLIKVPLEPNQILVNYFFLNSKMVCLYSDFTVQEIDIES